MRVAVVGFNLRAAALCRFLLGLKNIEVHWVLAQHDVAEPGAESSLWTSDCSNGESHQEPSHMAPPVVYTRNRKVLARYHRWDSVGPKPLVQRLESVFFDQCLHQNVWMNSEPNPFWIKGRVSTSSPVTTSPSRWVKRPGRIHQELSLLLELGLNWSPKARVLGLRLGGRPELILQAPEPALQVDRIYWCTQVSTPNFESQSRGFETEKASACWAPFGAWFPNSVLSPLPFLSFWIDPRHPELFETGEFFEGSLYRVLCVPEKNESWLQIEVLHFFDQDDSFERQKKRFTFLQSILPFADLDRLQRLRALDESLIQSQPRFQLIKKSGAFFEFIGHGHPNQIPQLFKPWIRRVKVAGSKTDGSTLR